MRPFLPFLAVILILSSFALPEGTVNAETKSATVASDNVNLRQGPGLSFPTVATGSSGETYEVLDEEYGWLKLKLSNGEEGWIAEWLTIRDTPPQAEQQASEKRTVTTDQLRIRSGPGTDEAVLGVLSSGDSVTVHTDSSGWLEVTAADGTKGWVNGEFISSSGQSNQDSSDTSNSSIQSSQGTILVDRLNVRNDFSSEGSVIGSLNQGDRVNIIEEQYGWLNVEGNGLNGWVSSTYVQYQAQESADADQRPVQASTLEDTSIVVVVDSLTVRNGPAHSGESISAVSLGESFTIQEVSGDWYKIELDSGSTGWIASWFTEPGSGNTAEGSSTNGTTVTVLYNGSNVRSAPSVDSEVVSRINSGEQYETVSQTGDWYEIKLDNGASGFIANWIVSADGEAAQPIEADEEAVDQEETAEEPEASQDIMSISDATILIDAGHGGRDGGAIGASGSLEKSLTLRTAEMLYHKLSSTGANVIMTRQDDRYIDLHSRVALSQQHQADVFVSIHYDSIDDRSVRGFTTYYYGAMDEALADSVHSGLQDQMSLRSRGTQFGNYLVLRNNSIPAILLELGYISNPAEEAAINSDHFRDMAATGIYNGLVDYFEQ
ncbi:SH3 domain-containing protein [Jeotgalibacillus proteolyticus]|nr:SH3 domain-containing protein [Jeotgalibacillus proteolyticus]